MSTDFQPFSIREIRVAANTLGNMHASGGDMERASVWLSKIQPQHRDFWQKTSQNVGLGLPLSDMLSKVWPQDLLIAVKAGEATGTLTNVYREIRDACKYTQSTQKAMRGLIFPSLIFSASILLSFLMLAYFLPLMEETFPSEVTPDYIVLGIWLRETVLRLWPVIIAVIIGSALYATKWLTDPENRLVLIDTIVPLPLIGSGLLMMSYGKWSRYMSIMHAAGAPMGSWEIMRICSAVLPPKLREPIIEGATKLESGSETLSSVFASDKYVGDDSTTILPPTIIDAFINGGEGGTFEQQLSVAAGILEEDGKEQFEAGIAVLYTFSILIAALGIGGPLLLYVIQMTAAVTTVTKAL